jgi:hypothetical protein
MSRYELEGNAEFRCMVVGCDEHLGTLFLQCPRRRPPAGQRKKGLQLWYPRLESRRELELLSDHHDLELPFAMLRQLEGELLGRAPLIIADQSGFASRPEKAPRRG